MEKVTRAHLAGLELALESLGAYCAGSKADAECVLIPLIDQANAAPGQEPFIYAHELISNGGGVWLGCDDRSTVELACVEGETGDEIVALYTHPAPSEAESLRGEREKMRILLDEAATAMIAAHESLFEQCLSNPIKNAWGKEVNVTAVNELQTVARRIKSEISTGATGNE